MQCLDVLRGMAKNPVALEAFLGEVAEAAGSDERLDTAVEDLKAEFGDIETIESRARRVVERMALVLQASLLIRFGDEAVADAFCASRLAGDSGRAFGTLPGRDRLRPDHHPARRRVNIASPSRTRAALASLSIAAALGLTSCDSAEQETNAAAKPVELARYLPKDTQLVQAVDVVRAREELDLPEDANALPTSNKTFPRPKSPEAKLFEVTHKRIPGRLRRVPNPVQRPGSITARRHADPRGGRRKSGHQHRLDGRAGRGRGEEARVGRLLPRGKDLRGWKRDFWPRVSLPMPAAAGSSSPRN